MMNLMTEQKQVRIKLRERLFSNSFLFALSQYPYNVEKTKKIIFTYVCDTPNHLNTLTPTQYHTNDSPWKSYQSYQS